MTQEKPLDFPDGSPSGLPGGFIDVHAHIAPTSFLKEAQKSAKSFGVEVQETDAGHALTFPGLPTLRAAGGGLSDTVARSEWMRQQGIGSQYMAAWLDIQGYTLQPDKEADWVRLLNEHLAETAKDAGAAFRSIAAVPLQDGERAARELQYAVNTLGMLGAMLPSDPAEVDVADPGLAPFWAAAEDLDVPVMLHGASHSKWPLVGPSFMAFSMGRTLDTTILAAKLIHSGLLDRHPNLKLVLCHGGGSLPFLIGRLDVAYKRGMEKLTELERGGPEAYMPMLYYDTVTVNPRSLKLLLDLAGPEHIMLGTDWVWSAMSGGLLDAVDHVGLDQAGRDRICRQNAIDLFRA
ncbi:MAG: amidohydrolase family protein [Chloroflexi bacterium]|nr:amidohydrolase family protein [Chloroflexota bacterium]MDA1270656.1 amidohydrolase family protein [Chloroflexota bacterium]